MSEELDHDAVEEDIKSASEEEREIVREGLSKTTVEDRQDIRDQVAEGLMTPSNCAKKYGISPQYVSKILKRAGIKFGCRKIAREAKEKAEADAKERALRSSFAERTAAMQEEHKLAIYSQLRNALMLEGFRQKQWREAALTPSGAIMPPVKDAMTSVRTMALIDQRIRVLLNLDEQIDDKALPLLEIIDMGDADIIAARRGAVNDDALASLDDDVVEETP